MFGPWTGRGPVDLARVNAARLGLPVEVRLGDLLGGLDPEETGPLDLIVSNPPYIEADELEGLPREVLADPVDALVGGVGVYRTLFGQVEERSASGAWAVVEVGERRAAAVADEARRAGAAHVDVSVDLTGRDRVVAARWP